MARPLSAKTTMCSGADQERCESVNGIALGVTSRHVKTLGKVLRYRILPCPQNAGTTDDPAVAR